MAYAVGNAADLPRRVTKQPKPTRFGFAYVARRADGAVLLERRPDRGLLGGMLGWPGTVWAETEPVPAEPVDADWKPVLTEVRHTFTHFHLILRVMVADIGNGANPRAGSFVARGDYRPRDLPTVMRKVHDAAFRALDEN